MRDRIVEWLNSGANARQGVQLMKDSGASELTLRLLRANPFAHVRMMITFLCQKYDIQDCYIIRFEKTRINIQTRIKPFREEFPFLNDPGCPIELEALSSRKFGKYHAYIGLHRQLRDCTDLQQCASVSKELIDNYIENRMIWEELNYYQKNKTLLGKHPIFREFGRRKKLLSLPVKELVLRQQQIENNIWRVKNEMKKGDKPHLDVERKERLSAYESELEEVKRLLE